MYGESDFGSTDYGNIRHFSNAFILELVDTTTSSDSIVNRKSYFRIFNETKTLSDILIKNSSRFFNDIFSGLNENIDFIFGRGWELIDSINLSDKIQKFTTKTFIELKTLSDSIIKNYLRFIIYLDSFSGLVDIKTHIRNKHSLQVDTIAENDKIIKSSTRIVKDTYNLNDSLLKNHTFSHLLSDIQNLLDLFGTIRVKLLNDYISLIEKIKKYLNGNLVVKYLYNLKNTLFSNKYNSKGTTFTNKYSTKGTTFKDKYPPKGTNY